MTLVISSPCISTTSPAEIFIFESEVKNIKTELLFFRNLNSFTQQIFNAKLLKLNLLRMYHKKRDYFRFLEIIFQ